MDAPVISISADSFKESDRDVIEIGVDVVHPEPDMLVGETEAERITLRARVRSLEVIETRLSNTVREEREREAHAKIERHLGLVQDELR
ncbi:hypothetical protein Tco_0602146 [Tanacetum coccineum]